jgi:hypothetical protein
VFTYRLILKDGSPADPPVFTTATPTWHAGDTFFTRPGRTFRILAINDTSGGGAASRYVAASFRSASSSFEKRATRSPGIGSISSMNRNPSRR